MALKKLPGVDSVDVSLNKGLATVKLKSGNTLSVPQFWQTIHQNGYTPKDTFVSARGDLSNVQGQMKLKISGTDDILTLVADPKNTAAYKTAESKAHQTVRVQGVMVPMKNLKTPVPLQLTKIE